jgi:hypothetical protein
MKRQVNRCSIICPSVASRRKIEMIRVASARASKVNITDGGAAQTFVDFPEN